MRRTPSLRVRLTAIILLPVLAVALAVAIWQLNNARQTATDVFDRSLLSAALAVTNDVAVSGGDALSPRTRDVLADTSGGLVYYHVYAPDGVIVAGYATPPVGIPRSDDETAEPTYFDAQYLGRAVSGVRIETRTEVDNFTGVFTTTVWQDAAVRAAFVRQLVLRSLVAISALIVTLALIIWFGVRIGLRPLLDLQDAIEQRSSDELSAIRRSVPAEVEGIVERLNSLFDQVSRSMTAQSDFISNAAHQLRNPIAGVLSLAEAVHRAPTADEAKRRSGDLLAAARATAELSNKLLLLERAKSINPEANWQPINLEATLPDWVSATPGANGADVSVRVDVAAGLAPIVGDPIMIGEAVRNLVQNARHHGGDGLSRIDVSVAPAPSGVVLRVSDDGAGTSETDLESLAERFKQGGSGSGSGLGLAIAKAVAVGHGGAFRIVRGKPGFIAEIHLAARPTTAR